MRCLYCNQETPAPCMNTRDMEDAAIAGSDPCYASLEKVGGGEKGLRYVKLNRDQHAANKLAEQT